MHLIHVPLKVEFPKGTNIKGQREYLFYFGLLLTCANSSSVIDEIFSRVDHHIEQEDLIKELNMSALPSLYENFVELIEYLVSIEDM